MMHDRFPHLLVICLFLLSAALVGCSSAVAPGYALPPVKQDIPKKPPEIDVTGVWTSNDWDPVTLIQKGADVSGTLAEYTVDGLVTGKEVYLFLLSGGDVYFTFRLSEFAPGTLEGSYYYALPRYADMDPTSDVPRYPAAFKRVSPAGTPAPR